MKPTLLTAGVAEAIITPPVELPLLGPCCPAASVHDDLYARALLLSDGDCSAAVICLDLVGMDLDLAADVEAEVRRQSGVGSVLLISSHTHSAPFTIPWSLAGREWLSTPEGSRWRAALVTAVGKAANEAASSFVPVTLRAGRAPAQAGLNRRSLTPDGVVMKPNPDGVVVPWVDVLCVDQVDGIPLAVLFSHAAHPVVVHAASPLISADYPGYACAAVRRALGGGVVAMFSQGCGGNINGEPLRGGFEEAERVGEALGEAVLRAVAGAAPVPAERLRTAEIGVSLPLRPLPPPEACAETLRECEERLACAQAESFSLSDDVLCNRDLLQKAQRSGTGVLPFRVSALAVGDAWCLLGMTHEVFAEYQLWLDGVSPWPHTMVAAYTNGCESYLPTEAALAEGGYEAASYPASGAALRYPYRVAPAAGCEDLVRDALQEALRQLRG